MTSHALWGADHHAVAFVVLAGGLQFGRAEHAWAMDDGDYLAADRRPLHMCVQNRQEYADARQWRCGQAEFGRGHRLLDQADESVRGRDDEAGAGRWHPRRVTEERGVGGGRRQTRPRSQRFFRPTAASARLAPTNGSPAGMHRRNGGAHQRHESRGACSECRGVWPSCSDSTGGQPNRYGYARSHTCTGDPAASSVTSSSISSRQLADASQRR